MHMAVMQALRVTDDRGELEMVGENTGEVINVVPVPIAVVPGNGSCFRGETCQSAFAGDEPLLRHVRKALAVCSAGSA